MKTEMLSLGRISVVSRVGEQKWVLTQFFNDGCKGMHPIRLLLQILCSVIGPFVGFYWGGVIEVDLSTLQI